MDRLVEITTYVVVICSVIFLGAAILFALYYLTAYLKELCWHEGADLASQYSSNTELGLMRSPSTESDSARSFIERSDGSYVLPVEEISEADEAPSVEAWYHLGRLIITIIKPNSEKTQNHWSFCFKFWKNMKLEETHLTAHFIWKSQSSQINNLKGQWNWTFTDQKIRMKFKSQGTRSRARWRHQTPAER